ncbi:heterokaryon incompatibility protein-domain-containing protein [Podospora aff. communis PSN243]|uniref:Heterokaryon incompatibility protein-domain-containing protein n=1 Tax=Podospora aff. communis PSN243 TaxID=3040156 RepID=A0AAV9GS36_9PEZI|nr:heterokaryon incompatibility protein-domain-containing protein [Podospora aff. communis PSN243]
MWLINTTTLQLEFFNDADDVAYVILSHTWGAEEITFSDMDDLATAKSKEGWHKIQQTCKIASTHGYRFAWIDTCCIDKSSSAELSEAINAMFSWYRKAAICYAYLADLHITPGTEIEDCLRQCRWFTRGWTLQELIASVNIRFYDASWDFVASKHQLTGEISRITGVDVAVLEDVTNLSEIPVGRRMAWASNRETTRAEDIAYCLLGIFDISIPPLYGEGEKAFTRLQEEIARQSNDLTLFAWEQDETDQHQYRAIFAKSPREFRNCSNLRALPPRFYAANEFSLTNRGLRIATNLSIWYPPHVSRRASKDEYLLLGLDCLECSHRTNFTPQWVAVKLERFGSTYVRTSPGSLAYCPSRPSKDASRTSKDACSESSDGVSDELVAYIARALSPKHLKNFQSKAVVSITFKPAVEPCGRKYYKRGTRGAEFTEIFEVLAPRNFLTSMPFPQKFWQSTEIGKPAIVFGFQGLSNELWAMPYSEAVLQKSTREPVTTTSVDSFLSIRDYVFERFSEQSGLLCVERMPSFIEFRDTQRASWLHRFSVRAGRTAPASSSTQLAQSSLSIGSFYIEFIHTIRDENAQEALPGCI